MEHCRENMDGGSEPSRREIGHGIASGRDRESRSQEGAHMARFGLGSAERVAARGFYLAIVVACLLAFASMGTRAQQQDTAELKARRQAALEKVPDGIVLLHSFNGLKHWDESGFHQDASFYYFTGLANAHEAILALDGIRKETWLFVAPRKSKFGADLAGIDAVLVDPGKDTEQALGIDHVVLWDEFEAFVERRRKEDPQLAVYLDSAGQTGHMLGDVSNPPGLLPIENPYVLWAAAIRQKWPDAKVKEVFGVLDEVRQVKSEKEIDW